MWMGIVSWWSNSKIAQGITAVILFLIGAKFVIENIKSNAKKAEKAANAQRNAEEHARTVDTARKVEKEISDAKDAALAAPGRLPDFPSADSVRDQAPDIAAVILRNRRGHVGGS